MRCPDCGYLLLDPKAHCPKCETTLDEGPAPTARSQKSAKRSAKAPRDDESAGNRSYPSLRLHGRGMGAGSAALALNDDDSSDPNLHEGPEPAEPPRAGLRVVDSPGAHEETIVIASAELVEPALPDEEPLSDSKQLAALSAADLVGPATEGAQLSGLGHPAEIDERTGPVDEEEPISEEAEVAASLAQSRPASLEEELADLSVSLTGKVGEPAAEQGAVSHGEIEEATDSVFHTLVQALPKEQSGEAEEISEWSISEIMAAKAQPGPRPEAPAPAPSPEILGEMAEMGARTGEIPPPRSYQKKMAPEPPAADEAIPVSGAPAETTQVSVPGPTSAALTDYSHPSIDRYASTRWPGQSLTLPPPAEAAQALALTPVAGPEVDPTQISFPKFSPPVSEEVSGEYPTAEIVGEATARTGANRRRARPTLRGKALGRRLLAGAVDNLLTLAAAFGFVAAAHWTLAVPLPFAGDLGRPGISWAEFLLAVWALRLVLDGCYQIGYLAARGHTPGKRLMGLQVEADGPAGRPSLAQSACRWAWSYGLTFGICWGYLTLRRDPSGRALHDQKAGTRMVVVGSL